MYKISVPVMNANVTRCGREKVLKELKYMNIYEAFVIDEILEVRHAKITANGEYSLYDEKPKTRKLIKKANIQDEHNAEDLKRIKAQVKHIEKAILLLNNLSSSTIFHKK